MSRVRLTLIYPVQTLRNNPVSAAKWDEVNTLAVGNLWTAALPHLDCLPTLPRWSWLRELVVSNHPARANDIPRAVHLLRQHGMAVGFPMQTAQGEIIFPVGNSLTLTADQILGLLERGELDAEGVRRTVEAQAAKPMSRRAASA
jgi:hypothetical protein